MSDETTLLPCPFCGGEAELKLYQNGDWQIICYHADGCIMRESDLSDCYWESVQTLARQWNTRADYHGYEHAAIEAWESIKAWNTRAELGSGTLTAEQVREVIERHVKFYEGGDYDEQAIADELNARAERTCHNTNENRWFKCSACGYGFTDLYAEDESDIDEQPRYCPNCGARVVA